MGALKLKATKVGGDAIDVVIVKGKAGETITDVFWRLIDKIGGKGAFVDKNVFEIGSTLTVYRKTGLVVGTYSIEDATMVEEKG